MTVQLTPDSVVSKLKGVGVKTAEHLQAMGLNLVQDLWFHLPIRYQNKTEFTKINDLMVGNYCLSKANVLKTETRFGNRRSLLVWLEDESDIICLRFFYFSMALKNQFESGRTVEFYGEVRHGNNCLEIVHPEFIIGGNKTLQDDQLTPVYSITKGIQQKTMQKLIKNALEVMVNVTDILPNNFLADYGFSSLKDCLLAVHCPYPKQLERDDTIQNARNYLVFEELSAYHFVLQKIKKERHKTVGTVIDAVGYLRKKCLEILPFKPTDAQNRVTQEIIQDLQNPYPMHRLLQGDVGSGKTLVAVLSALDCVEIGGQCVLMAPTELLARQHYLTIKNMVDQLSVRCELLTGNLNTTDKKTALLNIKNGTAQIVIGTHALIQSTVKFHHLIYLIIDEQHRFGVAQRTELTNKAINKNPNQLLMTATPIPRTLAMSFYAFLDYSVIDELPLGRMPVITSSIHEHQRNSVVAKLNDYCQAGKQAYWVCPLIEESEALQCQTANQTFVTLQTELPHLKIGLVHGQIKNKSEIMADFKAKKLDILVATTVIEVGVDVPNASLMIIDNSERLGLSQLHQLRGRVGRGPTKSFCILMYKTPLSHNAKSRINIMRQTNDGFKIAEQDLKIRGPGELLGMAQTGEIKFKLADFSKDQKTIRKIIQISEQLSKSCDEECQKKLIDRWQVNTLAF